VLEEDCGVRKRVTLTSGAWSSAAEGSISIPLRERLRVGRGPLLGLGQKAPRGLFPFFLFFAFSFSVFHFFQILFIKAPKQLKSNFKFF
jgi:hypothetical protein